MGAKFEELAYEVLGVQASDEKLQPWIKRS